MSNIERKIYLVLSDCLGLDLALITPDSRFIEDLGAESVDILDSIVSCEEEFDIEIDAFDTYRFKKVITVQDLVNIVEEAIKNKE